MARRNFWLILGVAIVSIACYRAVDRDPYGRYFSDVMAKIDRLYVEKVDKEKLFNSAIAGMIDKLDESYDDEHTRFFPPEEVDRFESLIEQHYGGVGIEVTIEPKTKRIIVTNTIVGSPAYAADILPGDQLLKVDDESAVGMGIDEASRRIRGQIGEEVRLTLGRKDRKEPLVVSLKRAEINTDTVWGDFRNPDDSWNFHLARHPQIGYIRIGSFGDRTADELRAALATLPPESLKGLILDLRSDPGGRLDAAVDVCGRFIAPGQTVVTTRGRDRKVRDRRVSVGPPWSTTVPMVVLVNALSASASEIVAACLQDTRDRAVICGTRTYGKGTVQSVLGIEGNRSILKLTTATYWRPSEKNIHRHKDAKETDEWGVMPDKGFTIAMTDEQAEAMWRDRRDRDAVLHGKPAPTKGETASAESAAPAAPSHGPAAKKAPSAGAAPKSRSAIDPQLERAVEHLERDSGGRRVQTPAFRPGLLPGVAAS